MELSSHVSFPHIIIIRFYGVQYLFFFAGLEIYTILIGVHVHSSIVNNSIHSFQMQFLLLYFVIVVFCLGFVDIRTLRV